jgi:hypothetical protein
LFVCLFGSLATYPMQIHPPTTNCWSFSPLPNKQQHEVESLDLFDL